VPPVPAEKEKGNNCQRGPRDCATRKRGKIVWGRGVKRKMSDSIEVGA